MMAYSLACDRMTAVDDPLFVKILLFGAFPTKTQNYPHSESSFIVL